MSHLRQTEYIFLKTSQTKFDKLTFFTDYKKFVLMNNITSLMRMTLESGSGLLLLTLLTSQAVLTMEASYIGWIDPDQFLDNFPQEIILGYGKVLSIFNHHNFHNK